MSSWYQHPPPATDSLLNPSPTPKPKPKPKPNLTPPSQSFSSSQSLIHQTLLHLDPYSLRRCTRVSKLFRSITEDEAFDKIFFRKRIEDLKLDEDEGLNYLVGLLKDDINKDRMKTKDYSIHPFLEALRFSQHQFGDRDNTKINSSYCIGRYEQVRLLNTVVTGYRDRKFDEGNGLGLGIDSMGFGDLGFLDHTYLIWPPVRNVLVEYQPGERTELLWNDPWGLRLDTKLKEIIDECCLRIRMNNKKTQVGMNIFSAPVWKLKTTIENPRKRGDTMKLMIDICRAELN